MRFKDTNYQFQAKKPISQLDGVRRKDELPKMSLPYRPAVAPALDKSQSITHLRAKLPVRAKLKQLSSRLFDLERKHGLTFRVVAASLALIMFSTFLIEITQPKLSAQRYNLAPYEGLLLNKPVDLYAEKLDVNPKSQTINYNKGYIPGGEVAGQTFGPKISASFDSSESRAVRVEDPLTNVSISLKPKFKTEAPQKDKNRVVYPIVGKPAKAVYTVRSASIKEDIILDHFIKDTLEFEYELGLESGMEARIENDGSLGVYGVSKQLLGSVSTGSEKDAELLKKARENGEKNNLLFRIPAPFILEGLKKTSSAKSWYSLEGNILTVHAAGLRGANYPLSIDPSVYVETAAKLMKGNNESNIDFDITNELIQKSQTTGARINGWSDSTEMNSGIWDQSTAAAGGYLYRAGGRIDPTMPYVVSQQSSVQATNSTSFVMNMPSTRPAGDLYVAIIAHDGTGAITPPGGGGWTEYADTREHAAYYKIGTDQGGGNESATYTFTGGSEQWSGVILRIKGFESSSPISGTAGTGSSASDAVPIFPTTTPSHDATLVIRAVGVDADQPSEFGWLPSGHTKLFTGTSSTDTANSAALMVASLDVPPLATNATGTATFVNDGLVNDTYGASSIAIRPATVTAGIQQSVQWARFNTSTGAIDSPNPGAGTCSGWCTNSAYNLPALRVGMSMISYNGFLYALGGTSTGAAAGGTSTVWIAKLGANGEPQLWHPTGGVPGYWYASANTLPAAASYSAVAAYNNRLYLLGGNNTSGTSLSTVHVTDLKPTGDISAWSTTGMQAMPDARFGHSVHVYNDVMYLIGGNSGGTLRNTVYYSKLNNDGTMNPWTATSNFTTARSSFGGSMSTLWGGYLYLAGGCTALTSGYCSTIANDVQLASINADGSLAPWNPILNLSNQRIGHSFVAWQNGLYRFGGCNRQNTSTGACYAVHQDVEYGIINPDGDASTVSNSEPANTAPCSGASPTDCDLPGAGDGAEQGGQMSSATVINNGFIYVIGGCTNVAANNVCENAGTAQSSGNIMYAALDSNGKMSKAATCGGTFVTNSLWCVDSTNTINGTTGLSAASATVFNNTIYVAGGTTGSDWQNNVWRVGLNANGSLSGAWSTQDMNTDLGLSGTADDERGYMYTFTRANPSAAGSNPGNYYMLGGCRGGGGATADGLGCGTYYTDVIKCNIGTSGALASCGTGSQLQIDADNINAGNQGLGLMAGTIYANRIYLVGGACTQVGSANDPCGSNYSGNRKDTIYASIDNNNNIVASSGGIWQLTSGQMNPVRRRAMAFGYNGYIYSLAGYSGSASLQDLLFAKIDVSTGDMGNFSSSGVVVTPRWDLRAIVSNGYVYALGGCGTGAAPNQCTAMQPEIQTFQLYNNDSGAPASYTAASDDTFAADTDRWGASAAILNGYIYVAGGCISATDCTNATNNVQYAPISATDGSIGTWASTTNVLPLDRTWGQLEVAGGTLYYTGGQDDTATNEQSTIYYATPVTGGNITSAWATATKGVGDTGGGGNARTKHGATVWNNRIYVVGGLNASAAVQTTVYVSPQLNSGGDITGNWTSTSAFNVARMGTATVAYANNLYLFGGFDGTNYLNDTQYTQINSDGTVDAWSYSTSLPGPLSQADAFASNGYIYLIGGRSAASTCVPNTIVTPVSANTTIASGNNPTGIGEWYETNVKYTGDRYGTAVAYSNGKGYVLGGGCTAPLASTRHYYGVVKSQPQIAKYSRMIDTDTDVFPTKWLLNGLDNSIGAQWYLRYRSSTNSAAAWGQETNVGAVTLGTPGTYTPKDSGGSNTNFARYYYLSVYIDSSQAFGYPEDVSRGPTITDLSLFFTADPSKRMRHGKTFTGGELQPLDTPFP